MASKVRVTYDLSDSEISESESESHEDSGDDDQKEGGPKGLVNVMANILAQKAKNKNIVLSKTRTIPELQKSEIEKSESQKGEVQKSDIPKKTADESSSDEDDDVEETKQTQRKKWLNMSRARPTGSPQERKHARELRMIATQGVVNFLNTLKKHQKEVKTKMAKAGSSVRKQEKAQQSISKADFVDMLKKKDARIISKKSKKAEDEDEDDEEEGGEKPAWGVLREDYKMKAGKMKDWDKEDSEEEEENEEDMDFDENDSLSD